MTSYQDQPRSRREVREREAQAARAAEAAASGAHPTDAPVAPQSAPEPLSYVTQQREPLPQYETPPQQSTPPVSPDAEGYRYRDFSPEGRRAARPEWQQPDAPADLDYRTQNRAPSAPSQPAPSAGPVTSAPPAYSPEPQHTTAAPLTSPPEGTMSRRELRALREQQERAQEASAPPQYSAPPVAPQPQEVAESTPSWLAPFTAEPGAASAPPAHTVPPPLVEPEPPTSDALADLEALLRGPNDSVPASIPPQPVAPEPVAPEPWQGPASQPPVGHQPASEPPVWDISEQSGPEQPAETIVPPWGGLTPGVPATGSAAPVVPNESEQRAPQPTQEPTQFSQPQQFGEPQQTSQPQQFGQPQPFGEPVHMAPPEATSASPAPYAAPSPTPEPAWAPPPVAAPEVPEPGSQPPVSARPRNHWSRQAELDDEAQPMTGSISRNVGSTATSNTLVLSDVPNDDIIMSPVRSTGDILVTGSISLPASLASTGALSTQLDESDLDNLLDPGDQQVVSTDSQPVRAMRAVSTHTSSREIIGAAKPRRGNRALTALIVAAAGMAVVVVTLLVVALTQGVLN